MSFICLLCGGLQLLLLLSVTGILVSLAALSRLMELTVTIIQPAILFGLRQSLRFIVLWTVLSLRLMSSLLRSICSTRQIDITTNDFAGIANIGTARIDVPYARHPHHGQQLPDVGNEAPSLPELVEAIPAARELESSVENAEENEA